MTNGEEKAQSAFEFAIKIGRLSNDPHSSIYAGKYMYMGTDSNGMRDLFKNSMTREYLPQINPSRHPC